APVPEVVEDVVHAVARTEGLGGAAAAQVVLPALPDDGLWAVEADRSRRCSARFARLVQATRLAEARTVPGFAEGRRTHLVLRPGDVPHVALAVEAAAARRAPAVVVHHRVRPEVDAGKRLGLAVVAVASLRVPLVADHPALLDDERHVELPRHRARDLHVLD